MTSRQLDLLRSMSAMTRPHRGWSRGELIHCALKKQGLIERQPDGWVITQAGRDVLAKNDV